jgi:5-methyltetrahydrofolate--homocysteine methyltransferase
MQKDDYFRMRKIPLLIGGATTSRVHTAVKIAPHYDGPVVYVPDASRSVAWRKACWASRPPSYMTELNADYDKVRQQHANKKQTPLWPLAKARANKTPWWTGPATSPRCPSSLAGACSRTLTWPSWPSYIDWGPFFQTWDLAGPYPAILTTRWWAPRPKRVRRRPGHAEKACRRPLAHRQRRGRPVPANSGGRRRHRAVHRRVAQPRWP